MPKAVGDLHAADAGHIVFVGVGLAALGYVAEPSALGPGEVGVIRSVEPVEGVGRVGIGNRAGYAVHGDPGELVGPGAVAIGVTNAVLPAGDAAKVARGIDGIIDRRGGCGRRGGFGVGVPGFLRELIQIVVGASNLPWQGEVARSAGGVDDWVAAGSFTDIRPMLPLLRVPAGRSSSPLQGRILRRWSFIYPRRAEALPEVVYCLEIGDYCRKSGRYQCFTGQLEEHPRDRFLLWCIFYSNFRYLINIYCTSI